MGRILFDSCKCSMDDLEKSIYISDKTEMCMIYCNLHLKRLQGMFDDRQEKVMLAMGPYIVRRRGDRHHLSPS